MVAQVDQAGAERAVSRRAWRFEAQRWLWSNSERERARSCNLTTVGGDVTVRASVGADGLRHGGFHGLQTCGSVWSCPTCSPVILARRQDELAAAVRAGARLGLRPAVMTFTIGHHREDPLMAVWDGVQAAHHAMFSGRQALDEAETYGQATGPLVTTCDVACCGAVYGCEVKCCGEDSPMGKRHALVCRGGQITRAARRHARSCRIGHPESSVLPWSRVVETKYGEHGWHVHQHMLVLLPADASPWALYGSMWSRWAAAARREGFEAESVNRVFWADDEIRVAEYLCKGGMSADRLVGFELARGDLKVGRVGGSRTSIEILADAMAGDEESALLWAEWEAGSAGRRQMTWAGGARELLEIGAEQTDEEIASEETGTADDDVAVIPAGAYRALVALIPGRRSDLLRAVEESAASLFALLARWGVPWDAPFLPPPKRQP